MYNIHYQRHQLSSKREKVSFSFNSLRREGSLKYHFLDFIHRDKCFALPCLENAVNFLRKKQTTKKCLLSYLYMDSFYGTERYVVENFTFNNLSFTDKFTIYLISLFLKECDI